MGVGGGEKKKRKAWEREAGSPIRRVLLLSRMDRDGVIGEKWTI